MSINVNWLQQKYNFTAKALVWQDNPITGLREPVYYDETDFNCFVDTALGSDSNVGTAAAPWKTLGKVKSSGSSYWGTGKKIAFRGFTTEYLEINAAVEIYGFGGGICGRAVFGGNCRINYTGTSPVKILNIHWKRITTTTTGTGATLNWYGYNILFENLYLYIDSVTTTFNMYWYHCIVYVGYSGVSSSSFRAYINHYGNNNTMYNITMDNYSYHYVYGDNNHFNNTLVITTKAGSNNKYNTDGQYLSVANFNFNFLNTSPLYHTGTYNPDTDNNNHVGAGTIGVNLTAEDDCLNDDVDAVYTNCDKSSGEIYRIDVGDDGIIESGIYDFCEVITRVIMNLNYTYEFNDGVVYRRIQETDGRTVTEIFDCIIRYGEIEADIADCPDLLIEYGKLITVSGTGANRKGNADASFDPSDMIAIDSLLIRHIKWWLKLKTVV